MKPTSRFCRNLVPEDFRRSQKLEMLKLLDPTLMTTMIGYEDRQVNTRALIHRRTFILYLRVYGVYSTN